MQQIWRIVGLPGVEFPSTDAVGDTLRIGTAVAHLLARTGPQELIGNRTSVLFYTPEDNVTFERITFQCEAGGLPCSVVTVVIGWLHHYVAM